MGLLSSPPVKILGGHGVICYYCFLFLCVFQTTPQSWRPNSTWQRCILVLQGGPLKVSSPFCFTGHNVKKIKLFPHSSFSCSFPLVLHLLLEYLKRCRSRSHTCVRKGRAHLGLTGCVSACPGQVQPTGRLWSQKKKAALKVNFYIFLFLLLYLSPNLFLARVIEVIATVPKETNKQTKI